jgi:restriction system protein
MKLPPEQNIRLPLLKVLDENGGGLPIHDAINKVTERYFAELGDDAKTSRLDSGQLRWQNRVEWARFRLIQSGELDGSERGFWRITPNGKKALEAEWASWKPRYVELRSRQVPERAQIEESPENPQEEIEEAHRALVEQTATDLLQRIMGLSPQSFELLVGELLSKMGYGTMEVTGRPGDQGIDGSCSIDEFGLYRVLFQAKRLQQQVPAKEVRGFLGAMRLARVEYGIFVTTSSFTRDSIEAAQKSGNLRLVDGKELANLLIKHRLGVVAKTLSLPEISEDFFASIE